MRESRQKFSRSRRRRRYHGGRSAGRTAASGLLPRMAVVGVVVGVRLWRVMVVLAGVWFSLGWSW